MRTNKKERKENAQSFYRMFMNGNCNKTAIVIKRIKSSNPNISKCQFIAVPPSDLAYMQKEFVIAESILGISGCFMELLSNIKKCTQKTYWEDEFNKWLMENYGFEITYKDGLVFMLEKITR